MQWFVVNEVTVTRLIVVTTTDMNLLFIPSLRHFIY